MPDDIRYDKLDGIATIVIDRPEVRNALRAQTYDELNAALADAGADDRVGVIVITGAGDEAFSAGGDVREQRTRTVAAGRRHARRLMELAMMLRGSGKPVIAAVNGYAVGGGDELQLMCDLTIASDRATFGQLGLRVGMPPVWGGTQLLPLMIGDKRAREAIFMARRFTAQEAYELGLINKVVAHEQLMSEVSAWCQELLDKSPQALRIAKISLNHQVDLLQSAFNHALEMVALAYGSSEYVEGVTSFLEKRQPDFRQFRVARADRAGAEP